MKNNFEDKLKAKVVVSYSNSTKTITLSSSNIGSTSDDSSKGTKPAKPASIPQQPLQPIQTLQPQQQMEKIQQAPNYGLIPQSRQQLITVQGKEQSFKLKHYLR